LTVTEMTTDEFVSESQDRNKSYGTATKTFVLLLEYYSIVK